MLKESKEKEKRDGKEASNQSIIEKRKAIHKMLSEMNVDVKLDKEIAKIEERKKIDTIYKNLLNNYKKPKINQQIEVKNKQEKLKKEINEKVLKLEKISIDDKKENLDRKNLMINTLKEVYDL